MNTCNCEGCELRSLFFEHIASSEIEIICSRKTEKTYSAGELIIKEGTEIHDFIYLQKGLVKFFHTNNKQEQIIAFAGPLDFVSLLSIFSESHYNYSATALTDTTVCILSLNQGKQMAEQNGRFAIGIIEKLNHATDTIILSLLEIKSHRMYGKVAYILLYFSREIYNSLIFELPVSRKEIAEYIGLTTENVIRSLSEFRKDGIIKISGKTIDIIDPDRLKKIIELD